MCLFPSGSEQEKRELEQTKIKLEEEIREHHTKLKRKFEYHFENKLLTTIIHSL